MGLGDYFIILYREIHTTANSCWFIIVLLVLSVYADIKTQRFNRQPRAENYKNCELVIVFTCVHARDRLEDSLYFP